jgi:KDO2-lipid IV(A) lauroyltransferase
LTRLTGSPVIPFLPLRLEKGKGYLLRVLPPLKDFPSDDVLRDTARINSVIEEHARRAPEQYLWIHRRFKDQPDGGVRIYTKSAPAL